MNKLFEAVPVSEKPTKEGTYFLIGNKRSDAIGLFQNGDWSDGISARITRKLFTHWLRPIPPPTKEAEDTASTLPSKELQRIPGEGDVQYNLRLEKYKSALECPCERCKEIVESYAQEASTGQAWEIRVLRDALERVRTMKRLPGENNDTYVFNRCWHIADAALSSTPSHTVEQETNRQS